MRSTINIGEPYLLATYQLPSKYSHIGRADESIKGCSSLFVTYSVNPRSNDGVVTVAAPGDGVHTVDLGALHSISAQTIGPTTTFACPAASFVQFQAGSGKRRTYVVVESGPDISKQQRRRIVWSWEDDLSDDIRSTAERKTFTVEHEIFRIYAPNELNSDVITLSSNGSLYWTDAKLELRRSWIPPSLQFSPFKAFMKSRRSCTFVQAREFLTNSVLLFCFMTDSSELRLRIFGLARDEELTTKEFSVLSIASSDIIDISFNSAGFLSVLMTNGAWHFFRVEVSNDQCMAALIGEPLRLKSLSFMSGNYDATSCEVALHALSSSHVLLAGISSSSTPEIALLIWDIQYSVLLCTNFLPIPSNIEKLSTVRLNLSFFEGSSKQAFLVLTPNGSAPDASRSSKLTSSTNVSLRSSLYVIPYDVPSMSSLANAIGRRAQGVPWLNDQISTHESEQPSTMSQRSKTREELLQKLLEAVDDEQPDVATSIFFSWYEKETAKRSPIIESSDTDRVVENAKNADPLTAPNKTKKKSGRRIFDFTITSRLMTIIFHSATKRKVPPPWGILHFLMEKNVVSHGMVAGGLLPVLLSYSHWSSILLALHHVIDIPEAEIVIALKIIVSRHREIIGSASHVDSMDVDSDALPTLPTFLALCVQYSSSTTAWRAPLRENFRDVEDLLCLLRTLENWFANWAVRDMSLISRENNIVLRSTRPSKQLRKKFEKVPDLDNLISFFQAILDSSFLALLQFHPAHRSLRKLHSYVVPQVILNDNLELLRGPLEPFTRAHTHGTSHKRSTDADWKKRRKHISEHDNAPIGLYQIEELAL